MTVFLCSVVRRTLPDVYFPYSSSQLSNPEVVTGHFMTLIDADMHNINCNLGHL